MTEKDRKVAWAADLARSRALCQPVSDRKIGTAPSGSWMTRIVVKDVARRGRLMTASSMGEADRFLCGVFLDGAARDGTVRPGPAHQATAGSWPP